MNIPDDLLKSFIGGSVSGTLSAVLCQPLDVIKTQLQITESSNKSRSLYVGVISKIHSTDGVLGFWKGLSPTLIRCVPGVGLYFSTLHFLNQKVIPPNATGIEVFAAAASARAFAGMCFNPITIIKTRFESGAYKYGGIRDAIADIHRKEGLYGFTRGIIPTIIRDAPFSGLYYWFYIRVKLLLNFNNAEVLSSGKLFISGVVAGCAASLITHPADIVKTYAQMYPCEFKGGFSGLLFIHKNFGIKGYFRGASIRLLRRTFITSMSWTLYEKIMANLYRST